MAITPSEIAASAIISVVETRAFSKTAALTKSPPRPQRQIGRMIKRNQFVTNKPSRARITLQLSFAALRYQTCDISVSVSQMPTQTVPPAQPADQEA
ncbi:MAG: hypothetical protein WBA37_02075 [Xanthobacteraceae bacterium]